MFFKNSKQKENQRLESLKKQLYFDLSNVTGSDTKWFKIKEKRYMSQFALPAVGTRYEDDVAGRYVTTTLQKPYLIHGPCGTIKKVQAQKLKEDYCQFTATSENKPITEEFLDKVSVNCKIDWTCVQNRHCGETVWAFFPNPKVYGLQNVQNFKLNLRPEATREENILNDSKFRQGHAFGDFIVANSMKGMDVCDLQTARVVNGRDFINMFDMRQIKGMFKGIDLRDYEVRYVAPKVSVLQEQDEMTQRASDTFNRLKVDVEKYTQQLHEAYFRTVYETGYNQMKLIIQAINGYTIGFTVVFKNDELNQADIQYFEMQGPEILQKNQSTGILYPDNFIEMIDRKIKQSTKFGN